MVAKDLLKFIDDSPNAFFATKNLKTLLSENGFEELDMNEKWKINTEGKYFVSIYDSACIAFTVEGDNIEKNGFKIIVSHTDSPCFKIKPNPEIKSENYIKLNTEVYGGPILNTWLDRPLSLAGKVVLKSINPFKPINKLININKPVLTIPNLAIHMNRKINEGVELNKQIDLLPIIGLINDELEKKNYLNKILAKQLDVAEKDILDFDLYLYPYEKSVFVGANEEFISAPRLDDLSMAYASVKAITNTVPKSGINLMASMNNEEVGSRTKQGADSPILSMILEKITIALNKTREQFIQAVNNSFMISADMAHAVHPNRPEKHDPVNKPLINEGVVIKLSASQRYATDSSDVAVYQQICEQAGIPVQKFVNRSDQPGGSTIGPINAAHLPIRTVDMGAPMLAMHSVREIMGTKDFEYIFKSFKEFYKI